MQVKNDLFEDIPDDVFAYATSRDSADCLAP